MRLEGIRTFAPVVYSRADQIAAVIADPLHGHEFNWIVQTSSERVEMFSFFAERRGRALANMPLLLHVGGVQWYPGPYPRHHPSR